MHIQTPIWYAVGNFFFFCGGITSLGSLATKLRIVTEPSHLVPKPFVCNVQLAAEVVRG